MPKPPLDQARPLILRCHRLIDAFAKSDDERDFYLNIEEGFVIFSDLDKHVEEFDHLQEELKRSQEFFRLIPKMTLYETKKLMEGFIHEKVYDIDTKDKLLDILQNKEARENFLEVIYDHIPELEKWQQYYYERSRIRIIEWLRSLNLLFVFEEDLDIEPHIMQKVKQYFFETGKVSQDVQIARKAIYEKSKIYYSNEALNPRPKRGRPPKHAIKADIKPQCTLDIYQTVAPAMRPFLYAPDFSATSATFSAKFATDAQLIASLRESVSTEVDAKLESLTQQLKALCQQSGTFAQATALRSGQEKPSVKAREWTTGPSQPQGDGRRVETFAKGLLSPLVPPQRRASSSESVKEAKKRKKGASPAKPRKKKQSDTS